MKIEAAFGAVLKKYRKKSALSQEQLAFNSNLDRTYISLLERGLRRPTLTTVFIISKALNVKPYDIVKEVAKIQNEI